MGEKVIKNATRAIITGLICLHIARRTRKRGTIFYRYHAKNVEAKRQHTKRLQLAYGTSNSKDVLQHTPTITHLKIYPSLGVPSATRNLGASVKNVLCVTRSLPRA